MSNASIEPTTPIEGHAEVVLQIERGPGRSDDDQWPRLGDDAYHGLAGEVVRAIEPHTEAHPVGMLLHYLTYFGNAIGRGPHYRVEGSVHGTNLFTLIVGETSKAKKELPPGGCARSSKSPTPNGGAIASRRAFPRARA